MAQTRYQALTPGNALTLSRLVLLPVVLAGIVTGRGYLAVAAMALAVVSDLLDGRVARRLGQASPFGGTLDSTVDFVFIYSLFTGLYASGRLQTYQFAIIYLAMLTAFVLQLWSMAGTEAAGMVRSRLSKSTGALQYAYLIFLVAREILPGNSVVRGVDTILFAVLAIMIILSSINCVMSLRRLA